MRVQFDGKSTPAGENTAVSLKTYAKNQASAGSSSAAGAASSIAGPVSITLTDRRIKPALLAFSIAACLNLLVRRRRSHHRGNWLLGLAIAKKVPLVQTYPCLHVGGFEFFQATLRRVRPGQDRVRLFRVGLEISKLRANALPHPRAHGGIDLTFEHVNGLCAVGDGSAKTCGDTGRKLIAIKTLRPRDAVVARAAALQQLNRCTGAVIDRCPGNALRGCDRR